MMLTPEDRVLVAAIQDGLPLVPRPYAQIGRHAGMTEAEVIERIRALAAAGVIRRFGIVVRHRELGFGANAMVVWDVPDIRVAEAGARMARVPFVTLCYRRPRRAPVWPYNLFCMIHGRDRAEVEIQVEVLARETGLLEAPRATLFSGRRFKQCGAHYVTAGAQAHHDASPVPALTAGVAAGGRS